LFTKGPQI